MFDAKTFDAKTFDAKRLLDAVVGALSEGAAAVGQGSQNLTGQAGQALQAARESQAGAIAGQVLGQAVQGVKDAGQRLDQSTGLRAGLDNAAAQAAGVKSADELVQKAREFMGQNPGLTQGALAGVAGLLLTTRKGRGLAAKVAGLGGLALVGGLAYKAFQNHQAGQPLLDVTPSGDRGAPTLPRSEPAAPAASAAPGASAAPSASAAPLDESRFHPVSATEDDALLYLRAMVAAAASDGQVDAHERERLTKGLEQAGIDAQATGWLDRELAAPATVDELAAGVQTPEKAAQVYAAARVAINADTMQEREFLRQLAEALDLDAALRAQVDAAAGDIRG